MLLSSLLLIIATGTRSQFVENSRNVRHMGGSETDVLDMLSDIAHASGRSRRTGFSKSDESHSAEDDFIMNESLENRRSGGHPKKLEAGPQETIPDRKQNIVPQGNLESKLSTTNQILEPGGVDGFDAGHGHESDLDRTMKTKQKKKSRRHKSKSGGRNARHESDRKSRLRRHRNRKSSRHSGHNNENSNKTALTDVKLDTHTMDATKEEKNHKEFSASLTNVPKFNASGNTTDKTGKDDKTVKTTPMLNEDDVEDIAESNHTVPWDTYVALLIKVSSEQLENVKRNIMTIYKLKKNDLEEVEKAFNHSGKEYEHFLQFNLKRIVEKKKFNISNSFMVDFMDISNYLLEQIISFDLSDVKGKLELPTKWYKQVLREKIVRQQVKIATNFVEAHLCNKLEICKERTTYTQFLTEWLRHLLNLSSFNMKNLFLAIPELLEKHMHTIKSNLKFKKTVKFIVDAGETVHRDTLDYLDEIINNQKTVPNLQPQALKNGAILLTQLFKLIEDNYELTPENEDQLNKISKLFTEWMNGGDTDVRQALEQVLQNLQINLKIWPLDQQGKIDYIWSQIIVL